MTTAPEHSMKVVAIIQARMGSSRLPGKVLCDLEGESMLKRVIDRVGRAKLLDEVIVATTDEPQDSAIINFCAEHEVRHFTGSQDDVLDRYYQAATQSNADAVVRITSDCPLIDPNVIDVVIRKFLASTYTDYVSCIVEPRTFPRGLDTEVFSYDALKTAWQESTDTACREHVTQYFLRNPDRFELDGVFSYTDYSALRWTVDTDEDLQLARAIYQYFGHDHFGWREAVHACTEHPEWQSINAHIQQKVA
jgi:spore coat polysaccharide biosynthesis protein SpsF